MPPLDDEVRMLDLRDQILVRLDQSISFYLISFAQAVPKDIEDLVVVGKLSRTCPYFGTRRAIPQAEVTLALTICQAFSHAKFQLVTLPYNLLLSKSARESLGIDLKGQIVVIDEAHSALSNDVIVVVTQFIS